MNAPAGSSGQYVLHDIVTLLNRDLAGREVELHWIPAHTGVPGNEKVDDLAKRATGWVPEGETAPLEAACGGLQTSIGGVLIIDTWLGSAMKQRCCSRAKQTWHEKWLRGKTGNKLRKIHPTPSRTTTDAYRKLDRKHSSLLTQARTGKTSLANYQFRIGNTDSRNCYECQAPETLEHVLLDCPNYDTIRSEHPPWSGSRETDIRILLREPAHAQRVAQFLYLTGLSYHNDVVEATENPSGDRL